MALGRRYFACNDRSHGGNGAFRNTVIAYAHYHADGTVADVRIDETGVGRYDASRRVEAEDYFESRDVATRERCPKPCGFEVVFSDATGYLRYANVFNVYAGSLYLTGARAAVRVVADGVSVGNCSLPAGGGEAACGALPGAVASLELHAAGGTLDYWEVR